jgi:hypothetical protein
MQALGPHVSENLGVERAPIEVREEGLYHTVTIGAAVDLEIEDVVSFGVETGEPARLSGIFPPRGLRADGREGDALQHRLVRDRVRGEGRVLLFALHLGSVT